MAKLIEVKKLSQGITFRFDKDLNQESMDEHMENEEEKLEDKIHK